MLLPFNNGPKIVFADIDNIAFKIKRKTCV